MQGPVETEVKIPVTDLDAIGDRIRAAGFHPHVQRSFEANTLYDTQNQALRASGHILRLRQVADRNVLTFKGQEKNASHKMREEIETGIDSFQAMHEILNRLGYGPVFRYEKFRTEYKRLEDHRGVVTLDQTPIGNFLELEGPPDWIDATARLLGFSPSNYLLDSYGKLYLADCERRGVEPANMVFPS
ncbi:MAG TPA: class IV adenylate cyclase [Bryobacteraceae bacterium]|jgi:adenylate cyclase class 2|nr:class IV adenylate cyclase [Bryobacteraceae bacterium]